MRMDMIEYPEAELLVRGVNHSSKMLNAMQECIRNNIEILRHVLRGIPINTNDKPPKGIASRNGWWCLSGLDIQGSGWWIKHMRDGGPVHLAYQSYYGHNFLETNSNRVNFGLTMFQIKEVHACLPYLYDGLIKIVPNLRAILKQEPLDMPPEMDLTDL